MTVSAYSIKDELIRGACSHSAAPMGEYCDVAESLRAFATSFFVLHGLCVLGSALEYLPLIQRSRL